jgi:hypothetical protein
VEADHRREHRTGQTLGAGYVIAYSQECFGPRRESDTQRWPPGGCPSRRSKISTPKFESIPPSTSHASELVAPVFELDGRIEEWIDMRLVPPRRLALHSGLIHNGDSPRADAGCGGAGLAARHRQRPAERTNRRPRRGLSGRTCAVADGGRGLQSPCTTAGGGSSSCHAAVTQTRHGSV